MGNLLYAERRFLTGTKGMVREANNPMLKRRLEQHVQETEKQIERLQKAFESIGEKAKAEKCEAAIGLWEDHDSFKWRPSSRSRRPPRCRSSSLRLPDPVSRCQGGS